MALSNGIYYISCVETGTFLQFTTGDVGINLSAWHFSGSNAQQWEIAPSTVPSSYTIRNSGSQNYPTWSGTMPLSGYPFVYSDVSETTWYIELVNSTYTIAPNTFFNSTWNVDGGYSSDDTPIILYPFPTYLNGRFNITAIQVTTATSTAGTSTTGTSILTVTSGNTPTAIGASGSRSTSAKNAGKIAGSSIGGVVGAMLLILAFLNAHHLRDLLASLAFFFGWWLAGRRRFVLSADKDLGPVEITLFLSKYATITDSDDQTLLVWQVFRIGHSRREFSIRCSTGSRGGRGGQTKLGFGTVNDHGNWIEAEFSLPAPATWDGNELTELTTANNRLVFKNESSRRTDIALGTFEDTKSGPIFRPFSRLTGLQPGEQREAETILYLHAFVTHGYQDGQYGETLVKAVMDDILTRQGIKLVDLKPTTYCHISKVDNKFKLTMNGRMQENSDV